MPNCINCAPSVTPLVVQTVAPLVSTGTGTPSDPLVFSLDQTQRNLAFTVADTDSVNLTIYGTGTDEDPYVLSADTGSAIKLTDLKDVTSPAPTAGQVPTWVGPSVGGHWEFKTPTVPTVSTTFDASAIVSGTFDVARFPSSVLNAAPGATPFSGDWNSLVTPTIRRIGTGTNITNTNAPATAFLFGTLVVFSSGISVTQLYFEHGTAAPTLSPTRNMMWWRTKWSNSDWTNWGTSGRIDQELTLTGANAMTAASGYPQTSASIDRDGNVVTLSFSATAAAGFSNAAALSGNIANKQVGSIPAAHAPKNGYAPISTTSDGLMLTGYVDGSGNVFVTAMTGGISSTSGAVISSGTNTLFAMAGTWVAKELTT